MGRPVLWLEQEEETPTLTLSQNAVQGDYAPKETGSPLAGQVCPTNIRRMRMAGF